ncbi:unnamed protein product [Rhizophagus irregularis]|nr:unnamed protein product [Rhizophagus irregularis]
MNASNNIAQIVWNKGKHTKLESLVDNEDFKEECLIWLRQQAPELRSPRNLKFYIEETVFPKKSMKDFDGDMLDVVLEPQLKLGEKELLVHQAIPIFELLHHRCIGVFCFDQSTNHNAMAADALMIASKMNLSPGRAQPKMRDDWYINKHGEKCAQSMIFPNNHKLKG